MKRYTSETILSWADDAGGIDLVRTVEVSSNAGYRYNDGEVSFRAGQKLEELFTSQKEGQ